MAEAISIVLAGAGAEEEASRRTLDGYSGDVRRLYEVHAPRLFRHAMAICHDADAAKDAVQDTFVKYCIAREAGYDIQDEGAWLGRVLHNAAVDWHRERKIRSEVTMEAAAAVPEDSQDPSTAHFLEQRLKAARALLSPAEMRCVELRASGMRYQEIAEAMGLRTGTIATFLFRAVRKLRHQASKPSR